MSKRWSSQGRCQKEMVRVDTYFILVLRHSPAVRSLIRPKKYICVFQVSALKNLGMVGRHNILFIELFYKGIAVFNTFSPIF